MVTDDNRETNLVAMVAVKANSVKRHLMEARDIPAIIFWLSYVKVMFPRSVVNFVSAINTIPSSHLDVSHPRAFSYWMFVFKARMNYIVKQNTLVKQCLSLAYFFKLHFSSFQPIFPFNTRRCKKLV